MLWSRRMCAAFETNFDGVTALRFGRYETAYTTDGNEFAGTSVRGLAAVRLGHLAEARALAAKIPATNSARGLHAADFSGAARRSRAATMPKRSTGSTRASQTRTRHFRRRADPVLSRRRSSRRDTVGTQRCRRRDRGVHRRARRLSERSARAFRSIPSVRRKRRCAAPQRRALASKKHGRAPTPKSKTPSHSRYAASPFRKLCASAASASLIACAPFARRARAVALCPLRARRARPPPTGITQGIVTANPDFGFEPKFHDPPR